MSSCDSPPNRPSKSIALTYLNDYQARTVEAIAEQVIPGSSEDPGATEAGVVYYIDRALSGFSINLQQVYRVGLRELDVFCSQRYSTQFTDLSVEQQRAVLRLLLGPEVMDTGGGLLFSPEDQWHSEIPLDEGSDVGFAILHRLFAVIREHTVEGYFGDPVYGGNRNAVGWRLVGFPGAQWGYTAEQMKPGFQADAIPIKTLSDLRTDLENDNLPPNERFYSAEEE